MTEKIHSTLKESGLWGARAEDDVLFRENFLLAELTRMYADDKPSTRWSRFVHRLAGYRDRVRDAWAVLRGRASIDY